MLGPDLGHGAALGRYVDTGDEVWLCAATGAHAARVTSATAVAYIDAIGAAVVETESARAEGPSEPNVRAWTAATPLSCSRSA